EYPWPVTTFQSDAPVPWVYCGIAFGSLMFLTQFMYGEVSIPSRLVVFGVSGPSPNPWGGAILMELATGFLLSCKKKFPENFIWWWFVGCHGTAGLLYFSSYFGLMFAIFVALYVTSVWPEVSDRFSSCPVVHTTVIAFTVYLTLQIACIWVTAYSTVPLGWILR
ncbi:PGAP2-interacting protein-like, partial [Saccoglossus kowalevskii]